MSTNTVSATNDVPKVTPCTMANMPLPTKEHAWLQNFVGDWTCEVEMFMSADQPVMTTRGSTRDRLLGGFWLISEGKNETMPYSFVLTLGYDPKIKKYIGTWADSMTSYLWRYEGTVDPTGKILTLETEGPFPPTEGKVTKFKEITEFKSPNHRVYTSYRLGEDGKWSRQLVVNSRRK